MILCADYEFYVNEYQGRLSYDLFNFYINKASLLIKKNINKPLKEEYVNDQVKMVACQLVDLMYKNDKNQVNYSIDGVTKTTNYTREDFLNDKREILNELPLELISGWV